MLSIAVNAVSKLYPAVMAARWGNASVEQALAAAESERNKGGGDGGASDSGILTDDDIRRLLDAD